MNRRLEPVPMTPNLEPNLSLATDDRRAATEIISQGRAVHVSDDELAELTRECGIYGWWEYCQHRLTMGHAEALKAMRGQTQATR